MRTNMIDASLFMVSRFHPYAGSKQLANIQWVEAIIWCHGILKIRVTSMWRSRFGKLHALPSEQCWPLKCPEVLWFHRVLVLVAQNVASPLTHFWCGSSSTCGFSIFDSGLGIDNCDFTIPFQWFGMKTAGFITRQPSTWHGVLILSVPVHWFKGTPEHETISNPKRLGGTGFPDLDKAPGFHLTVGSP